MGDDLGFTTRALQGRVDPGEADPLSVPIFETSTFAFPDAGRLAKTIEQGKDAGFVYSRWHNPTRAALEDVLADLEGAEKAVSFSSGMAAISTVLATLLRADDHAVFSPDLYGGTFSLARRLLPRWGIDVTIADSYRAGDVLGALREETVLCYVETIGNPRVSVPDLEAIASGCRERGVRLVVDNTFASPYLCTPLSLGADLVLHSTTKYVGGHHDLTGGVAAGDAATMDAVREFAIDLGGVPSPFDAWLALRGVATLSLRIERHCANALALAEMLEVHPKVAQVWYPGLRSHPDHEVAARILRGSGGMLAFELAGGLDAGKRLVESVRVARMAASLGGVHTLVIHPATVTHTQLGAQERRASGITDGLVRVSAGIEDAADIVADFERALERC